jgi:CRP-like cAMP-binding protein
MTTRTRASPLPSSVESRLSKLSLFAAVSRSSLDALLESAQLRTYAKGEQLFAQGETADRLYILLRGKVGLFAAGQGDAGGFVDAIHPVDFVAPEAVLSHGAYPASARALDYVTVLEISAEAFEARLRGDPELGIGLLIWFAEHMRALKQENMALANALDRVMKS